MLSLSFRQSHRLEQRQRLSLAQRLIHKMKITPLTQCPQCEYRVDPERDHPWSEDPLDILMTCPKCQHRFTAYLLVEPLEQPQLPAMTPNQYAYLCLTQTLHALLAIRASSKPRRFPGMERLQRERPDVFYSAIRHFGDLNLAITAARERAAKIRAA